MFDNFFLHYWQLANLHAFLVILIFICINFILLFFLCVCVCVKAYMYQIVSSLVVFFRLTSISYKGNHERPRRKNLPPLCWRDGFYWSAIEALQVWLRGSNLLLIKVLYFFCISFSSSNPFLDSLLSITNDRSSLSSICLGENQASCFVYREHFCHNRQGQLTKYHFCSPHYDSYCFFLFLL